LLALFRARHILHVSRQRVQNNTKLSATKLAAEIKNHLHNKVNPNTFQREFRKNDFHGRVAEKKSFVSQKNQREWNLQKVMYWRVWSYGKQFYFLMKANIMYLDQVDVIMCGKYPRKGFGGKKKMFVQLSNIVLVV